MLLVLVWQIRGAELRVVTINIWSGLDYEGTLKMREYEETSRREQRYGLLCRILDSLNVDIVAVNEANKLPGYARRLARDLDCRELHTVGNGGIKILGAGIPSNLREGDAILAQKALRLKKIGRKKLSGDRLGIYRDWLTFHFNETNFVILGMIESGGRKVYLANTHLHASILINEGLLGRLSLGRASGQLDSLGAEQLFTEYQTRTERRIAETRKLLAFLDQKVPDGAPLILMGDFNDVPGSAVYQLITESGKFTDTFQLQHPETPGYTWNPQLNSNIHALQLPVLQAKTNFEATLKYYNDNIARRIDFIFVRNIPAEWIRESRIILNQPTDGIFPSDHFGVLTIIHFPEENSPK
jgi:endonuclease/exonuclease/phosphatase family metal-dependent hydrolase